MKIKNVMGILYTHDFDKARSVKPHEYNAGDIGVSNIVNLAENLHQEFQLRVRGQKHHGKGVAAKKKHHPGNQSAFWDRMPNICLSKKFHGFICKMMRNVMDLLCRHH